MRKDEFEVPPHVMKRVNHLLKNEYPVRMDRVERDLNLANPPPNITNMTCKRYKRLGMHDYCPHHEEEIPKDPGVLGAWPWSCEEYTEANAHHKCPHHDD